MKFSLIAQARPLYADEDLGLNLDDTVYALDSSTVDLYLAQGRSQAPHSVGLTWFAARLHPVWEP